MPRTKKLKDSVKFLFAAIAALVSFGTVLFSILEGWSLLDSFYFVTMTATTVGYGDLVPTNSLSKLITICYAYAIVPFVLYAFTVIAKYETERVSRQVHGIQRKQVEQEGEIEKTERKIKAQKRLMKEQQEILDKQERRMKKQAKINKEQEEELEGQERKIKKNTKEIKEHDEELEVVEDIVEDEMAKKLVKSK